MLDVMAWCSALAVRYGTVRYSMVWYGMVWYGMVIVMLRLSLTFASPVDPQKTQWVSEGPAQDRTRPAQDLAQDFLWRLGQHDFSS